MLFRSRRWDPAVRERFHKLILELGKQFDGKIEGINLPETATSFGSSGRFFPEGFTAEVYRESILANMEVLKRAFPKSVAMVYANFMPGEWLPGTDNGYLASLYQRARQLKVAMGGPDLLPYKRGQMNHSYRFLPQLDGVVPTGIAVQFGNYDFENPKTNRRVTIQELFEFASDSLKVDYIFWSIQEPYYSKEVIPFLNGKSAGGRQIVEDRPGRQ